MTGQHIRRKSFERDVRILQNPERIAGIETDADEVLTRAFDQRLQLTPLHVSGMIFDRDLQTGVDDLRADISQNLDGVLDVPFDRDRSDPIVDRTQKAADDR